MHAPCTQKETGGDATLRTIRNTRAGPYRTVHTELVRTVRTGDDISIARMHAWKFENGRLDSRNSFCTIDKIGMFDFEQKRACQPRENPSHFLWLSLEGGVYHGIFTSCDERDNNDDESI
jgi:hypothetical protein